jgi:dTDP-4-dehydrorhamnose reductase
MRALVLGAQGMLGRVVAKVLRRSGHDVLASRRPGPPLDPGEVEFLVPCDDEELARWLRVHGPLDLVVNCIGVPAREIRVDDERSMAAAVLVNTWLPHALAATCAPARLVHISTDAVFSPMRGEVHERDATDPSDVYGLGKRLGEPVAPHALSVRLSIVGLDPRRGRGLVERALADWRGGRAVEASDMQLWSGATVLQAAELMERLADRASFEAVRALTPVLHFAPNAVISKAVLLRTVARVLGGGAISEGGAPARRLLVNDADLSRFVPRETRGWPELIEALLAFEQL